MTISVLYIVANLDIGGAERHIAQIVPKFDRSLINASVFTIINKGRLSVDIEHSGIPVFGIDKEISWQQLNKLQRIIYLVSRAIHLFLFLRRQRPDVIHFFLPMPYLMGGFVALFSGVRYRVMSRRSLNCYQKNYRGIARIERWLHQRMSRILGNSRAVLDDLHDEGVKEQQLGLIYNGVTVPSPRSLDERVEIRLKMGISSDELLITVVANLIPYKGHEDLLCGLAHVYTELPKNWKLICVGKDSYRIKSDLLILSKELEISDRVIFLGSRDDAVDILQASDIAVLCSHEEGFSNAVLEGMAAGLPSVVTDVGGNAEAIRDGIDGYVIPANSPETLGKKISDLLCDEKLRKTMGGSARLRAQTHFSVESCVHAYEKMYQEITSKKSHSQN